MKFNITAFTIVILFLTGLLGFYVAVAYASITENIYQLLWCIPSLLLVAAGVAVAWGDE